MSTSAQWFAPYGIEKERNIYFRARTALEVTAVPPRFAWHIAAESWYRLWCNDVEVSTGPARGTSTLAFFDTLDLSPCLKSGTNDIEVLVACAGIPTFKAAPLRPALWVQMQSTPLVWHVARDISFDSSSPLYTFQIGFCEWRDLRVAEFDWHEPEYFALDKKLLPRDCDFLEVTKHGSEIKTPSILAAGEMRIIDFGREITGGAQIEIEAAEGIPIEVGYGERIENGRVRVRYRDESDEDGHTFADRFTTRAGRQHLGPTLQERGYRFLQIYNEGDRPIELTEVTAIDRRYPTSKPDFRCADDKLQRLYDVAHHTLSSCATDVIVDCPWREAALWINDLVVNAPFWLSINGDYQLIARCLRLALSERNRAGLTYGVAPHGDREEIVFLSTNTFLPLILLELASRDANLLEEFLSPVGEVMDALTQYSRQDNLLVGPPEHWNFLEWSFAFNEWELTGRASASINWFYLLALEAMAALSKRAQQNTTRWLERADHVANALHACFWDAQHEYYREFEDEDKASELAQALACISDRDERKTKLLSTKLAANHQMWLKPELYMMHFVLRALIENGHKNAAKQRVLRHWSSMIDAGSPTLWEANVHQHGSAAFGGWGSLCHAFSCAPLWALPRIFDS